VQNTHVLRRVGRLLRGEPLETPVFQSSVRTLAQPSYSGLEVNWMRERQVIEVAVLTLHPHPPHPVENVGNGILTCVATGRPPRFRST